MAVGPSLTLDARATLDAIGDVSSIAFERDLEVVIEKGAEKEYAKRPFGDGTLIPFSDMRDPVAEEITYYEYDRVGFWKRISNYATDFGAVDVFARKRTYPVTPFGSSIRYSLQEIRRSQRLLANGRIGGMGLEQRKTNACYEAYTDLLNHIFAYGDPETGLPGLLTHRNVPRSRAAYKLDSSSTPQQILFQLHSSANNMVANTNLIASPDTLLLPVRQYHYCMTVSISSGDQTKILEDFIDSNPYINNVEPVNELMGAGTDGSDIAIYYSRDSDKLEALIPQPIEFFPVDREGLDFFTPAHARIGGVHIHRPMEVNIVEGI